MGVSLIVQRDHVMCRVQRILQKRVQLLFLKLPRFHVVFGKI